MYIYIYIYIYYCTRKRGAGLVALADAALPAREILQLGLPLLRRDPVEQLPAGLFCQQLAANFHGYQQIKSQLLLQGYLAHKKQRPPRTLQ